MLEAVGVQLESGGWSASRAQVATPWHGTQHSHDYQKGQHACACPLFQSFFEGTVLAPLLPKTDENLPGQRRKGKVRPQDHQLQAGR